MHSQASDVGTFNAELKGAGILAGAPIVAPAGRTCNLDGSPNHVMKLPNGRQADFSQFVGADNRIPKDPDGRMMHGPIFTSNAWELTSALIKGPKGENGIKVTYTLDFNKDEALKAMAPNGAKLELSHILEKDQKGRPIYTAVLVGTGDGACIGPIAQHNFLDPGPEPSKARLTTNATEYHEPLEGNPALCKPNTTLISAGSALDFSSPKLVHLDNGRREAVLTGYPHAKPSATLRRSDGLNVKVSGLQGANGILLCNANPANRMVEPIQDYPNCNNKGHISGTFPLKFVTEICLVD